MEAGTVGTGEADGGDTSAGPAAVGGLVGGEAGADPPPQAIRSDMQASVRRRATGEAKTGLTLLQGLHVLDDVRDILFLDTQCRGHQTGREPRRDFGVGVQDGLPDVLVVDGH